MLIIFSCCLETSPFCFFSLYTRSIGRKLWRTLGLGLRPKGLSCNGKILTMETNKALGLDYVCRVAKSNNIVSENLDHFVWGLKILHITMVNLSFNGCVQMKERKCDCFNSHSLCRVAKNLAMVV